MSNVSSRRVAAIGASAAMLGAVIAAGVGGGVANATPTFVDPACKVANQRYVEYGADQPTFSVNKNVEGDGVVVAGGKVTYTTVVAATKFPLGLVSITDIHPAGFTLEKAEVQAYRIPGMKQKWSDETAHALLGENSVTFKGPIGNWSLAGQTVTLRTTYKVPSDVVAGAELDSGTKFVPSQNGVQVFDPMNVCVQVGEKPASGSLGSFDLGSLAGVSSSIFGSLGS